MGEQGPWYGEGVANVLDKMSVGMQQAVDGMQEGVEVPARPH